MYYFSNRWYIIGIVSYGIGCGTPDTPAIYTNAVYFQKWIVEKLS
jgi:secreted trypsin-like serine protease